MKRMYACLLGNWIDITDDGTVDSHKNPSVYIEEESHEMFKYDYINIQYQGKNYRIHPSFIQIVTE